MNVVDPPLSLYVHLPWCVRKCPYCDFNSRAAGPNPPRARYLDALDRDLDDEARHADGRELVSVFLGGGTPSLFTSEEIGRLLDGVRARFEVAPGTEITMEANPGTVECGDPAGYRAAGVNRLSIGAQSFDAAALGALGRIHSVADIGRAFRAARTAGFTNLNLDLMYGLPGQTVAGAMADVDAATALGPDHLSWYQLTLEPNTVFHTRPPAGRPDEDTIFEIEQAGRDRLAGRGYARYEVSAFARPGRRSVHNLNYWTFGDYLAVGAGAHGKLTRGGEILRYAKPANPLGYMEALENGGGAGEFVPVTADERVFEFMLNALRLVDGFTEAQFTERTGLTAALLRRRLSRAVERGLVGRTTGGGWCATEAGGRFLNDLQAEFLPA